jgi:hypothetical protein
MHTTYNYSGFVDLYRRFTRPQAAKSRAGDARRTVETPMQRLPARDAQARRSTQRQRLRLISS